MGGYCNAIICCNDVMFRSTAALLNRLCHPGYEAFRHTPTMPYGDALPLHGACAARALQHRMDARLQHWQTQPGGVVLVSTGGGHQGDGRHTGTRHVHTTVVVISVLSFMPTTYFYCWNSAHDVLPTQLPTQCSTLQ